MILQRTVKKVLVFGALALAFLQRAGCKVSVEDTEAIKTYWRERIDTIKREIRTRRNLLKTLDNFSDRLKWEDIRSFRELTDQLEIGKINLSGVETSLEELKKKNDMILFYANFLEYTQRAMDKKDLTFRERDMQISINEQNRYDLENLLLAAFKESTLIVQKISKYDQHILRVIQKCNIVYIRDGRVEDLSLFKLAKEKKIVAASIVFSFINMNLSKLKDMKSAVERMHMNVLPHVPYGNVSMFMNMVKHDLEKDISPLVSADRHLHLLCDRYAAVNSVMDARTVDIYFTLLGKDLSEKEIKKHRNITPGQVVKIIIIECLLNGRLLDHRKNDLFFALGRVVEKVCKPKENNTNIYKRTKIKKVEKQDEILNALKIIWSDCCTSPIQYEYMNINSFCEDNGIDFLNLTGIQNSFISAKWMYDVERHTTVYENEIVGDLHFDMSYTHPMWYIYKRCEYVSHLTKKDLLFLQPFMEVKDGVVILRPHRITQDDDSLEREQNIKICIRAWFSLCVRIISRKEDGKKYNSTIVKDFADCLRNDRRKKVEVEETEEKKYKCNFSKVSNLVCIA
ncbi:hypothetical protein NEMIN01_1083 [Nematocida minor]|uniref:uncharacterized protein n=1 Tax=Nematocida minor TaxID=1912983 RepID=UPI00221E5D86|nr:uncharacterized protein NEMIN01_1083 [Nematocida minor]KAI5190545.1 hypothetical protein NEMIN01_1083 [Nematocida minor]